MHYMAVTGAKRWYLAVLVLNQGFYTYTIERDEAEISALMQVRSGILGICNKQHTTAAGRTVRNHSNAKNIISEHKR